MKEKLTSDSVSIQAENVKVSNSQTSWSSFWGYSSAISVSSAFATQFAKKKKCCRFPINWSSLWGTCSHLNELLKRIPKRISDIRRFWGLLASYILQFHLFPPSSIAYLPIVVLNRSVIENIEWNGQIHEFSYLLSHKFVYLLT